MGNDLLNHNFVYIDFEYNSTKEKYLNLVCCYYSICKFGNSPMGNYIWLHNSPKNKTILKDHLAQLNDSGYIFVAYSVEAEGGSLYSLGLNPSTFRWIDLRLEYKMITNHYHKFMYGKHLLKGKKINTTPPPPKWEQTEEDKISLNHAKPEHNLVSCTYKMLGIQRDSIHKNDMRDLIISNPETFTQVEQQDILKYCKEDVVLLPKIHEALVEEYTKKFNTKLLSKFLDYMLLRGDYGARSAIMERLGYPINVGSTRRFSDNVGNILRQIVEDINSQNLPLKPFHWNKKEERYSLRVKDIREWSHTTHFAEKWTKTDKGLNSLSLESIQQFFPFNHDYPRDNLGAQIVRYLKVRQSLNGFLPRTPNSKKKSFWDSVGSDGRVRPYMNIYGAQSSRSQPPATSFIPLKAAWLRSLIQPNNGRAICGIDYGSQEFFISALISGDRNMIKAYKSGDVYLYFAKLAGAVPQDGTKEKYKETRDLFKSTVLGVSYGMSKYGLADKLTSDTGKEVTQDEAQDFINKFEEAFPRFTAWKEENLYDYQQEEQLILPCGWVMFGDNDNSRSINNVPIQGAAASIMRQAVRFAQDDGLDIVFTLHDALYMEYYSHDYSSIDKLHRAMIKGFTHYFDTPEAKFIRCDANIWSPDYIDKDVFFKTPTGLKVKQQRVYIDDRSRKDYDLFKEYL